MHRYEESLCLVQFCDGTQLGLIDPLAIDELSLLLDLMEHHSVWMHGADYDIQLLKLRFGRTPETILDTQTAARFVGYQQFGYAAMVKELFGVELSKSSQRADWAKRPLSQKMQEYALNDVRYMLPMAEALTEKLHQLNRYHWFLETCKADLVRATERPAKDPDQVWRIKGSGRLEPKALAFLKALWLWRDQEAKLCDRPCFMVARNAELIEWAELLASNQSIKPKPKWPSRRKGSFNDTIHDTQSLPSSQYPQRPKRQKRKPDPQFDAMVDKLDAQRRKLGQQLNIEPAFLISRAVIEQLAHRETAPEVNLMTWQEELFHNYLPTAYTSSK